MASINDLAAAATIASSAAEAAAAAAASTAATTPVVRGALIVLEGLDRSGKTTQAKLLEQRFVEVGRKVKMMRFPDRSTPIGQMIDAYLKSQTTMDDHVIHLLFSANRWEAADQIHALLASGTSVILDRYYHSGIVYSAAKENASLTLSWARRPEVGLPRPDAVLFLDLDEEAARRRGGWGDEAYEKADMQRRVRELFWGLSLGRLGGTGAAGTQGGGAVGPASAAMGEGPKKKVEISENGEAALARGESGTDKEFAQEEDDLVVLDAAGSVEEVAEEIWKVVEPRVAAVERGEVGRTVRRVS